MAIKGRSTQSIANCFPPWSNIRSDRQSLGYQLLNTVGLAFDDLKKQMQDARWNSYLPTANLSDICLQYPIELPYSYTFSKDDDDLTSLEYTPPTVSGIVNGTAYQITIADPNSVEGLWYETSPTRLSLVQEVEGDILLASGFANQSPLSPLTISGILPFPNYLTIQIEGGTSYIALSSSNVLRRGAIQIDGITRAGEEISEEIAILYDETVKTMHEYQSISAIRMYGMDPPDETFVTVKAASFNMDDYQLEYELDNSSDVSKAWMPLFWKLGSSVAENHPTLDLWAYDTNDLDLRLEGYVDKYPIFQQELAASGVDLAIEPRTNRLWVVGPDTIYIYDANMPYPACSGLKGKNYEAYSILEVSDEFIVEGEDIEIDYLWKRPVTGLVAHRVWVVKPDGTKKSLEDGVETTYHNDTTSWIYGEPYERRIRRGEIYTLDQRGEYVYNLEVRYTDGTSSIDKRIVMVVSKTPLATYSLSSLGIVEDITAIDFDSEHKIWVRGESGTLYQLDRHYDKMIIDFNKKIIYLREPYDKVRVF